MSKFCKHCGSKLSRPNAAFCSTCGRSLVAAAPAPPASAHTQRASLAGGAAPVSQTGAIALGSLAHLQQMAVFTIGRDAANPLRLDHPTVSRRHAQVQRTAQGHTIRDLGSSNGVYVNGQRVGRIVPLQPGDVVQIGPFKLVYSQNGFAPYSPNGNYRLDGISLRRVVATGSPLSPRRWLPGQVANTQKLILNDVTLSVYPREFVALVGGSGAGKSTLMNALSGFAPAQGQVLINGDDLYANFDAYRSILGYVPQQDIIHGQLTVASALHYAARLRLPDLTPAEVEQRVGAVLAQVELAPFADRQISRLSGGQRKRVSIAVELLADPGLFFLDEPSSGLDPGLERKLMHTLRQLADDGRTIVLVTHATANIHLCTHVAFMADGRLAYFGPPKAAAAFFGGSDFAEIYNRLSQPLDTPENPIPIGLKVHYQQLVARKGKPPSPSEFWEQAFRASPHYQSNVAARTQSIGGSPPPAAPSASTTQARANWLAQFWTLTQRYFTLVSRDWTSLFTLLLVMPLIGLLLLLMAGPHDLVGREPAAVQREIQEQIAEKEADERPGVADEQFQASHVTTGAAQKLLFMLALAAGLLGVFAAAYEIVAEEGVYRRERMVNLKIVPYLLSKIVVLGGFALLQCLLLLLVVGGKVEYPAQGIFLPAPVEMFITLFLSALAGISLGLAISAAVRSSGTVIYVILLVLFVQILFAGAIFELPGPARPLSYLTTTRWTLEALGSTVDLPDLERRDVSCVAFENEQMRRFFNRADGPCREGQMRQPVVYGFTIDYSHRAGHLLIRWVVLIGFALAFGGLAYGLQRRKDVVS